MSTNKSRPILLIDMDGVLADLEQTFYVKYKARYPQRPVIEPKDRNSWLLETQYPAKYRPDIMDILDEPGFFRNLYPVAGAKEAMNNLWDMGWNVVICTSSFVPNPTCPSDKIQWIGQYLGLEWKSRCIQTPDKTLIVGDYLVDDKPNVSGANKPQWQQVLFRTPGNDHVTDCEAVNNWGHAVRYFKDKLQGDWGRADLYDILR